jgi:hypothetical protein
VNFEDFPKRPNPDLFPKAVSVVFVSYEFPKRTDGVSATLDIGCGNVAGYRAAKGEDRIEVWHDTEMLIMPLAYFKARYVLLPEPKEGWFYLSMDEFLMKNPKPYMIFDTKAGSFIEPAKNAAETKIWEHLAGQKYSIDNYGTHWVALEQFF